MKLVILFAAALGVLSWRAFRFRRARRAEDASADEAVGVFLAGALKALDEGSEAVRISGPTEVMDGEMLYLVRHGGKELAFTKRTRRRWWAKVRSEAGADGVERFYGRGHRHAASFSALVRRVEEPAAPDAPEEAAAGQTAAPDAPGRERAGEAAAEAPT